MSYHKEDTDQLQCMPKNNIRVNEFNQTRERVSIRKNSLQEEKKLEENKISPAEAV